MVGLRFLPIEKHTLPLHAPGVSRKRAVVPDDPMGRDNRDYIVGGASAGDGSGYLGRGDRARGLERALDDPQSTAGSRG
jgi:hypothetical protein